MPAAASTESRTKRAKVSQTEFPQTSLEAAMRIASVLRDQFAGKGAAPHDVAMALGFVPTSGGWRNLCGTSIAYGLSEGGYSAKVITLTDLGRQLVAPRSDGEDQKARIESVLRPHIMKEFFEKYDRSKFPSDTIAVSVLVSLGLPKERGEAAVQVLKENGQFANIIRQTKTGLFVALDGPGLSGGTEKQVAAGLETELPAMTPAVVDNEEDFARRIAVQSEKPSPLPGVAPTANRVFISHGKNRQVVNQLREILTFGNFEPIISVERETTSIPVPEKVFQDMRACSAAVIHVMKEADLLDAEGNTHTLINQNVLIEIGAAMALYGKRFVLLVEKGLPLPSNLQGLYRCEYEGQALDYEATMKLLKTFNEIRKESQ